MVVGNSSREKFNEFLQIIIEVFSEDNNIKRLLKNKDYFGFIDTLGTLIGEVLIGK